MKRFQILPFCLLVACSAACSRGESAEERQLDELRRNMDHLSAEQDRRVPLEAEINAEAPVPTRSTGTAPAAPRRTIHFLPEQSVPVAETGDGDADDPSQLPSLRMNGNAAGAKRGAGALRPASEGEGDAPPAEGRTRTPGAGPSSIDPDARKAYDAAVGLVQSKQYALALESFASFMVKWPDHPYVENAMYWRGECFYAQGDHAKAKEQFDGVLSRFPGGGKAPDALLRLGLIADKAGEHDRARAYFERIRREFPRSESARHVPREEKK